MFAKTLMCSWIGALVLTSGAFCQTFHDLPWRW
jgi:hypothetical protein